MHALQLAVSGLHEMKDALQTENISLPTIDALSLVDCPYAVLAGVDSEQHSRVPPRLAAHP